MIPEPGIPFGEVELVNASRRRTRRFEQEQREAAERRVADRDLVMRVVLDEYHATLPRYRLHAHWIMDGTMWQWIRDVLQVAPVGSFANMAAMEAGSYGNPDVLMGLPVEIRDGAEGIRLEPLDPR